MNVADVSPDRSGFADETRTREILRARARVLARPSAPATETGGTVAVLEFRLARERYAIEQRYVREVLPLRELTPLPGAPKFMPGIVNAHGQILPVLDIKRFFDLPETGITDLHVVVAVQAGDIDLGILADAVAEVHSVPLDALQPSLPTLTGIRAEYLKGVTTDRLIVLDARRILSDPGILVNQEIDQLPG